MGRPFKCPYCASTETVSKGVRRNKTVGVRRVRRCTACRRKFTPRNQQPLEEDETSEDCNQDQEARDDAPQEPYYQPVV